MQWGCALGGIECEYIRLIMLDERQGTHADCKGARTRKLGGIDAEDARGLRLRRLRAAESRPGHEGREQQAEARRKMPPGGSMGHCLSPCTSGTRALALPERQRRHLTLAVTLHTSVTKG
jgi:hypothetical protein